MSLARVRTSVPFELISMSSSVVATCAAATSWPLRSVVCIAITPWPPRPWTGNSSTDVSLPKPFSDAISTRPCGSGMISEMTCSPSGILMPRTPEALRPIGRTSSSAKRMALPSVVHSMTSRKPSVSDTPTSLSPSSRSTAMMPAVRGRENAASDVFLTVPFAGGHENVAAFLELADGQHRRDALAVVERQQVDDGLAARAAARLRQLVDLEPVELPAVREAEQRVVRVGDEQLLDEILVLHRGGRLAAPAAALRAVLADRLRLGVAAVRQRDHDVLRRDQVFDREVGFVVLDARAARVAVLVADLQQLVADHLQQALRAREDVAEIGDDLQQFGVLGEDLVLLEAREAVQPQVEDRLGLRFGQPVFDAVQAERRIEPFRARRHCAGTRQHLGHRAAAPAREPSGRPSLRPAPATP